MNFRWITMGIFSACLFACALNITAALLQFRWMAVPYILIRLVEILIIMAINVTCMMLMKKEWNLGVLILACCIVGFVMLFIFYLWAVTVAMFQMIGVVNGKEYKERLIYESKVTKNVSSNQKTLAVATISPTYNDQRPQIEMFASDFSGLKNYRRI